MDESSVESYSKSGSVSKKKIRVCIFSEKFVCEFGKDATSYRILNRYVLIQEGRKETEYSAPKLLHNLSAFLKSSSQRPCE